MYYGNARMSLLDNNSLESKESKHGKDYRCVRLGCCDLAGGCI